MPTLPHSPAAERNRVPILAELRLHIPAQGQALEIASGTGQHVAWFGTHLPGWQWQPTDHEDAGFEGIRGWCADLPPGRVRPPRRLDVCAPVWPSDGAPFEPPGQFDLIYNANMLHISPWATCDGLMAGAARHLSPQGCLVTYGPYLEAEVPTAPSNQAFDHSLRERDPAWGLRELAAVAATAQAHGLTLAHRVALPANNLLLVWRRLAA